MSEKETTLEDSQELNDEERDQHQQQVSITDEMSSSYLDYAMSVIVSRALPDARDGLKPVHRRIIYSMKESGYEASKPYKKSARIVGNVMGKYHPHGDQAIYDAMVRMAQDFSLRLPLIDGQGNFGSMDGDNAAAMRYTEARMAKSAAFLVADIDKKTVNFIPNYDESTLEPAVLPARYPNLLANGSGGIAVGMATSIPPHNLGEVIDACIATINNPNIDIEELIKIVKGPDFPTGGIIVGEKGVLSALRTGRGIIKVRAKVKFEDIKNRHAIIVTNIPYQVNKSKLIAGIATLVRDGVINGVHEIRDESDRHGVRIVLELKKDVVAEILLNNLYKHSQLQISYSIITLALKNGYPRLFNLLQLLETFIEFREEVVVKRTVFDLNNARKRAHILLGLLVSVANIDKVIALIKKAPNSTQAKTDLMDCPWPITAIGPFLAKIDLEELKVVGDTYHLSEMQAKSILDLRLHRLTGMEREKISSDMSAVIDDIGLYLKILHDKPYRMGIIQDELLEVKQKFATKRLTEIEPEELNYDMSNFIQSKDVVLTITKAGYVKIMALENYKVQKRGGKGRKGINMKDADSLYKILLVNTHDDVLFFTDFGLVYKLKVWEIPESSFHSRGRALINLLNLQDKEKITDVMKVPEDDGKKTLVFATNSGKIRRNKLADFSSIRSNGKIAMKLKDKEKLVGVRICQSNEDLLIATKEGKAIRFSVEDIRIFVGRSSSGIRAIRLNKGDEVISISVLFPMREKDLDINISTEDRKSYMSAVNARRRLRGAKKNLSADEIKDLKARRDAISVDKFTLMQTREQFILTVIANGFGQLASSYDYRITSRGGKGVNNMNIKGSSIKGSFVVEPKLDDVMITTSKGIIIRQSLNRVRTIKRGSIGLKLIKLQAKDKVMSITIVREEYSDKEQDS